MLVRTFPTQAGLVILLMAGVCLPTLAQRIDDGQIAFEEKGRPTRILRQQLFKGEVPVDPRDKTHQEAVEFAAKEVTYPLIWKTMASRPKVGEINGLVEEFDGRLVQMARFRSGTLTMQQVYCKQIIDRAAEVIQNDKAKPIASVNAARMISRITERRAPRDIPINEKEWSEEVLPRLAEGNADHLANVCVTLLEEPKTNDGVRYYLFHTLANLLNFPRQNPPLLKKPTEDKVFSVAIKQIEKKVVFPRATSRQEIEGYKALRLQAIKVLAEARVPVSGSKDRPALTLARVAGNDAEVVPLPRIEERLEASIGLARMGAQAPKFPDFQMDYAAAQIVSAVAEFGIEANANLEAKIHSRLAPWKVLAARIGEALELLKATVKTPYVQQATDQSLKQVALAIERGVASNPNEISDWLIKNPPPVKSLFRADDTTVIHPAGNEPAEDQKPPEEGKKDDKGKDDKGKDDKGKDDKGKKDGKKP